LAQFSMAGFEVTSYGRIWVTPEDLGSILHLPLVLRFSQGPKAKCQITNLHSKVADGRISV
jgi:hypothetical protein